MNAVRTAKLDGTALAAITGHDFLATNARVKLSLDLQHNRTRAAGA
jgi:hypothetical protein